jgi:tRNA (adenine37-N6)-methyltransferase
MDEVGVAVIGRVVGGRRAAVDDDWGGVRARIELDPTAVEASATLGLEDFSHVEVTFLFDRVRSEDVCRGARHPRGRTDWPLVGILAQRAKGRPSRIGITVCRLLAADGLRIDVAGLDAIEGTPVLDVKPVMAGFLPRGEIREPAWATELMRDYW